MECQAGSIKQGIIRIESRMQQHQVQKVVKEVRREIVTGMGQLSK